MPSSATTPVLPGFFPDPSICRVGDTYVLANSSFEYVPAVPIWSSPDLRTWTQLGNALDRDDQFLPGQARSSGGIYAPTIRHHDGRSWLITTNVSGPAGQLLAWAEDPAGPWSTPITIAGLNGIDPDLAWDDDGSCLVTYCATTAGQVGIAQARVDLDRDVVLEDPRAIWSGTGLAHPEAPHLYRRGDWWYLLIAEGGTERGHAVSIARSSSPRGPFESCPQNPIFSRRSQDFPVQNAGHADLVERPDGTWAMVYLGVRVAGATPLFHVNGRETFLADVAWVDDWPVVDPDAETLDAVDTSFVDSFDGVGLDPRWISPARAPRELATPHPAGGVTVAPDDGEVPSMLAVRARDPRWEFTARTTTPDGAAVRVRMDDAHWYELRIAGDDAIVEARVGPMTTTWRRSTPGGDGLVSLTVRAVDPSSGGPDDLAFAVSRGGEEVSVARLDGRYLSTEVAGGFVGRVIGLRATDRPVHVVDVRYRATAL